MKIEEAIKKSMAAMIERKFNIADVVVTEWYEEFEAASFDGCDTCGYGADEDKFFVEMVYFTPGKAKTMYKYEGTFGGLIKELDA